MATVVRSDVQVAAATDGLGALAESATLHQDGQEDKLGQYRDALGLAANLGRDAQETEVTDERDAQEGDYPSLDQPEE